MSYLESQIKEKYKDRIDFAENKWTALRKLQQSLEEKDFDSSEIQLLEALITDIISKHGGSKDEVFRALYSGYTM